MPKSAATRNSSGRLGSYFSFSSAFTILPRDLEALSELSALRRREEQGALTYEETGIVSEDRGHVPTGELREARIPAIRLGLDEVRV